MYEIAWGNQKFRLETTWFPPFQMGSLRQSELAFEVMQLLYSHFSHSNHFPKGTTSYKQPLIYK